MTLIVVRDKNMDMKDAEVVATVLCAIGFTRQRPGGMPFGEVNEYGGAIEITCENSELPFVKAGFVAVGFSVMGQPRSGEERASIQTLAKSCLCESHG